MLAFQIHKNKGLDMQTIFLWLELGIGGDQIDGLLEQKIEHGEDKQEEIQKHGFDKPSETVESIGV